MILTSNYLRKKIINNY